MNWYKVCFSIVHVIRAQFAKMKVLYPILLVPRIR